MAAGLYNFEIEIGAYFERTFVWRDADRNLIPTPGYTAKLVLRELPDLAFSIANDGNGRFLVSLSAAQTAALARNTSEYTFTVTAPDGKARRLLQGKVFVR